MKRKKWNLRILLAVTTASLVLGGCQGTQKVPAVEKLASMDDEKISEKLSGFTREELVNAWGEPDYDLFGDGDLFMIGEEGDSLCVYYEGEDESVKYARLNMFGGVQDFTGIIEDDFENTAVVRIDDNGYSICSSGHRVTVDLTKGEERLDVEVGDHVYVQYIGAVMESSPLQLMDQISVSVIENAGSFEDVDDALLEANTLEGVTMTLLDVTPTSAKIGILNTTDLRIQFGDDYNLQVYAEDDWKDVPYLIDNWAFNAIAYMALKDQQAEWDVDWTVFHGELEPGKYRIVKAVMDFRGTGDWSEHHFSVEFEIPEEE